jgi:hypothetical protein
VGVSSWWLLLGVLPLGALVTVGYDHLSGRAKERRDLRREGSQVVTPVRELVNGLGPEGIAFGSDEHVEAYLRECFNKWWNEGLRERLMIYLNHHPSGRVRKLGEAFAVSVGVCLASTRYHFLMRKTATTMDDYYASENAKADSLAKADALLDAIRSRQWLKRLIEAVGAAVRAARERLTRRPAEKE